ncbi:MAG: hypothetical protein RSB86_19040 [Comamonas sp.]|uniref:hypothetical protein n=1 Tax=Comamonas sp. TaxID=34028 RepID=UPI002FCB24B6
MEKREIIQQQAQTPALPDDMVQAWQQMAQAMRGMADMARATNERMTSLEQQVRLLTKVTPLQASEINTAMKQRASELCESHHAPGCDKAVAAAIRRDVRLMQGVQSLRELPRCEYTVTLQQVRLWDDYKIMKAIKAKGR